MWRSEGLNGRRKSQGSKGYNSIYEKDTRWSAYLRHAMPDPREHIGPNTFLKYRFSPYLSNGEESLWKLNNSRIQICIRIFTKIESIRRGHTPNMSTKFRPNPSTTFWDIVLYIVFGPISQWWRITLKILVVGSGSGSSPKSNQFVLVTHPTCPPSFVRIRPQLFEISCYISFLARSLNGEESLKKINNSHLQIQIRIFTKIESIRPCYTPNLSTKFHPNPSTTFWDIVLYIVFGPISQWWRIT